MSEPFRWRVHHPKEPKRHEEVLAESWFEARHKGLILLGGEPSTLVVAPIDPLPFGGIARKKKVP